jgi:hypothetical protein
LNPSIWSTLAQDSRRVRSSSITSTRMLDFTSGGIDSGSRAAWSAGWDEGAMELDMGVLRNSDLLGSGDAVPVKSGAGVRHQAAVK